MKFYDYIKNKWIYILSTVFIVCTIYFMGFAFKCNKQFCHALTSVVILLMLVSLLTEYFKKRKFFNQFKSILEQLEEKYLIAEMIKEAGFVEGEIFMDAIFDIDKAMIERINKIELSMKELREYLEMWIHEVKVPLASLDLMNYNKNADFAIQKKEIEKLKQYVEQVLFYTRVETTEKDCLMKQYNLDTAVNNVVKSYKSLIIGNKISIEKNDISCVVTTDSKWLEFVIGQIVNNSIKYVAARYKNEEGRGKITFSLNRAEDTVTLIIRDNGVGISKKDLPRVFEKSFTGENGRITNVSTGMGLYICKQLCVKLGHKIEITSEPGEYTELAITFGLDKYYGLN